MRTLTALRRSWRLASFGPPSIIQSLVRQAVPSSCRVDLRRCKRLHVALSVSLLQQENLVAKLRSINFYVHEKPEMNVKVPQ
jgi:hypothetical protein